jgi:class 3 adenylate cyclase/tetratricopeptide (TPR) repeat protein
MPAVETASGERRNVAVLVADVADSTAIGERLGPERSKFLFDEVVGLMREQVRRYDGTVAQLTGDGVLALFGAPVAHEDDSERAVRAALAIHAALVGYGAEVAAAYGIELAARVAINTGPVVVPAGDLPDDARYNALGDTVNVAARLQSFAGTGGTALGAATARQVERVFPLEQLGDVELKGKEKPLAAFRVVGEREAEREAPRAPLVGRERELRLLVDALAGLTEGRGAIVSVTGEAGIGKSRLLAEARDQLGDEVRFLSGTAVSYADAIPYYPIRELLRDWLGLGLSEHAARVRLELKAGLAGLLGEAAQTHYPFLATLHGLEAEPDVAERLRQLGDESVQHLTVDAVLELVRGLARERPLCLVLEDLHWADEATLELADELLALPDEEPLVVVLVYRSERDLGAWELGQRARQRYPHRLVELELAPLDAESARALAKGAADGDLPESLASLLVDRAGGNPFFLEEALHDLVERGALTAGIDSERLDVPALVQEAVQARLDRLAPATREVVQVAAVVGRTFALPLLERLAPRERLLPALSELQRLELVVEARRRPVPEYRFRHGLVQEVAYASVVEVERRLLHRRVGGALEDLYRDAPAEALGLLAHHIAAAEEPAKALGYLVRAGDAARGLNANEEAAVHYERALDALGQLERTAEVERCELELALGEVRLRAGRVPEARRYFTQARERARRLDRPDVLAQAALGFAGLGVVVRDVDVEAVERLEEALAALRPEDDVLRARILGRLAIELYYAAPDRRESLSEEAVVVARRTGDTAALLDALNARHVSLWRPDRLAERLSTATEMLELAQRVGDRDRELQARNWRVADLWEHADLDATEAEIVEHDRLARELMLPGFLWYTPLWRAAQAMLVGRFEAAETLLAEALRLGEAAGDRNAELMFRIGTTVGVNVARGFMTDEDFAWGESAVGSLPGLAFQCALVWRYAEAGREAEARAHLEVVLEHGIDRLPRDVNFLTTLTELAEAAALLDETSLGADVYRLLAPFAGAHVAASGRALLSFGSADYFLARLAALDGRVDDARRHYEEALRFETRLGARPSLARTQARYAALLADTGDPADGARAEQLVAEARATADEIGLEGVARILARVRPRAA